MSNALMDIPSKIDSESLGEVSLTKAQREAVAFTKYESQNPMISDTQHHGKMMVLLSTLKELREEKLPSLL